MDEYQKSDILRIFAWILYAQRPLRVAELVEVLSVREEDTGLNRDMMCEKDILELCCGFVIQSKKSILEFTHQTAQIFLEKHHMKDISPKRFDIAATCLHYLQSDEFGKDYRYTFGSWTRYQALHYIINHWGDHVKDAEDSEYVQTSVVAFLASAGKRSWMQRIAGPELRRHYLAPYHCRVWIRNNLQTCPRGTANWTWQCVSTLFL